MRAIVAYLLHALWSGGAASAFQCRPPSLSRRPRPVAALPAAGDGGPADPRPQAFATGYSTHPSLPRALEEATAAALASLPPATDRQPSIDLALVVASSLYEAPSTIVADVVRAVEGSAYRGGVRHLVGGTAGGVIGSVPAPRGGGEDAAAPRECRPVEAEATPAVAVTLALLPDVEVRTFHVGKGDVPEWCDGDGAAAEGWKRAVGLAGFGATAGGDGARDGARDDEEDAPIFLLVPSPAFQNDLDDFLRGLAGAFPAATTCGGVASTVSSLTRARLFAFSAAGPGALPPAACVHGDGVAGVALRGDVRADTLVAQGAKAVGGVYRVAAVGATGIGGQDLTEKEDEYSRSTIGAVVLDEAATVEDSEAAGDDEAADAVDDAGDGDDAALSAEEQKEAQRSRLLAEYAKARIPKPPLAEANFVMKALSDDDQASMRSAILIGLERGGAAGGVGRTPGELARLSRGEGHRFTVRQVASAGMKDGSVTFSLGSVNIEVGARCRYFVRDGDFAKKEVEALWTGYKKKELEGTLLGGQGMGPPTACLVLPTLDRGAKLFGGKTGYESGMASEYLPGVPSISGFFANGVLGGLDGTMVGTSGGGGGTDDDTMLHGSSSQYVVFRSKTKRPFYSPRKARLAAATAAARRAEEESAERRLAAEDDAPDSREGGADASADAAPRSPDGEVLVRRREIHSGRAMSVSTVEWSVAERTAKPTSALEGYMWEKETQVDRLRERVPLANLLSQTKLAMMDPRGMKVRDWAGAVRRAAGEDGRFVIVPECKRMEPVSGSLRKRYDLPKLAKQLTLAGAPAISVNNDGVLFGGALEDITKAREASNAAANDEGGDGGVVAPPVLASDLLLYPYQLYKFRLMGADAVTLVVGALESKDLVYLTKIAKTVQLQVVASVTSEVQLGRLTALAAGSVAALVVSNRDLATFGFDDSGEQALALLRSEALRSFREKHGEVLVLVEGRVGIVAGSDGGDSVAYIRALKEAGAFGAIVGGGMAMVNEEDVAKTIDSWA